ncbi:MAG TPA: 30S ribosomal protein S20 [Candidatus Tumulicola sp.]|nr:30S ribosomal protein S20 [Candidatus Tumulicola sp.]
MPNIKAAEKWSRQSQKRATRNKDADTRLKTLYKKAVASGPAEATSPVESAFDKAAGKGIIHPNKAARKKARLAKAVRAAAAGPAVKTKPSRSTKSKAAKK